MMQETRQKYYYPCMAKYIKKWVSKRQICIQTERINNHLLRTEFLNCPEWDLAWSGRHFADGYFTEPSPLWRLWPYHHSNRCLLKISVCLPCNSYFCNGSIKSHHGNSMQTHISSDNDNHGFRHSIQCKNTSRSCSSAGN